MKYLVVIALFFISITPYAQGGFNKVELPSPTAASLARFADVPVNNYTGLPDINVPIHTIESGALQVPIKLQYHGGGIKVSEEASWVGLGWSLNAGGSISRIIKGNDDLVSHVYANKLYLSYLKSDKIPDDQSPDATKQFYKDIYYNGHDSEPDVFYYNFGEFSGKFVLERPDSITDNEIKGRPLDAKPIKIRYFISEHYWLITDPVGNEYRFSVPETTTTYSFKSTTLAIAQLIENKDTLLWNGDSPNIKVTAWYLKEISSKISNDKVTFEYESNLHNTKSQIQISQMVPKMIGHLIQCSVGTSNSTIPFKKTNSRVQFVTRDVYLSRINFSNGYVSFDTSDRTDMVSIDGNKYKPQKLNTISVHNNDSLITRAQLDLDYFSQSSTKATPEYDRLKLNGITINDRKYNFKYEEPKHPISKLSLSIDHWGYFNNAVNNNLNEWGESGSSRYKGTLIPSAHVEYRYDNGPRVTFIKGADRDPNEEYTKSFVLNKITLPTGGTQILNWEANTYRGSSVIDNHTQGSMASDNYTTNPNGPVLKSYESKEFEVKDEQVLVNFNFFVQKNNPSYTPKSHEISFFGYYKWENGGWKRYGLPSPGYYDIDGNKDGNISLDVKNISFSPGRYKLYMSHLDNMRILYGYYYDEVPTIITDTDIDGSGLRIHSIQTNDGIKSTTKKYEYLREGSSLTSGEAIGNPVYFYTESILGNHIRGAGTRLQVNCAFYSSFLYAFSSNFNSLNASGNTYVGYSRVINSYEGDKNQGQTVLEYYNDTPKFSVINPPPNFPVESNPKNGKLLSVLIKNENGEKIEEKSYFYRTKDDYKKNTLGIFTFQSPIEYPEPTTSFTNPEPKVPFYVSFNRYNNYSDWCYLSSEKTINYDSNGENPITNYTIYNYDNDIHLQATNVVTKDSNDNVVTTQLYYPDDVTSISSLGLPNLKVTEKEAIDRLKVGDLHRVVEPIQKIVTLHSAEGTLLSSTTSRTNFKEWDNSFVLPASFESLKGVYSTANDTQITTSVNDYDTNGNPLDISQENGSHVSYIWGYNKTLPIAKLENVAYSDVPVALLTSIINASNTDNDRCREPDCSEESLRVLLNELRTALPEALITTYTYDPLIGATSITDPRGYTVYYDYDSSNRLKDVIDAEGHIVSRNKYHYIGQ